MAAQFADRNSFLRTSPNGHRTVSYTHLIRQGGQHPCHRAAAVRGVVHTDQIFFFYAEIHASDLHFVLLAAGRCLFRAGGLFCFGKLLAVSYTHLFGSLCHNMFSARLATVFLLIRCFGPTFSEMELPPVSYTHLIWRGKRLVAYWRN